MINEKTIAHIAKLARLRIGSDDAALYSEQLSKALGDFAEISKVNTDGVEPMVTPMEIQPLWRTDEVRRDGTPEEMTENAPDRMGNLFKVPPVV